MKKPVKLSVVAALLAIALTVPITPAFAYKSDCGRCEKGQKNMFFHKASFIMKNDDALGLTDKQKDSIRDLKYEVKKNLIKQEADLAIIDLDIKQQLKDESADLTAINPLIDQKHELEKTKEKFLVESTMKLKQNLTADQTKKMKELYKEKKKKSYGNQ